MIETLKKHRDEVSDLCRRYRVERLELFGSAAGEEFDPASSDLDFLVSFQTLSPGEHADAFFGLKEALEELLGYRVELVEIAPIKNPYFLKEIEKSRELIYAR